MAAHRDECAARKEPPPMYLSAGAPAVWAEAVGPVSTGPPLARSAAGAAVVVEVERGVQVHLDGGAVGLGDGDLVAVARNVGGDVSGGAAADGLDGGACACEAPDP